MIMTSRRPFAILALALALASRGDAFAQDGVKPKPAAPGPDKAAESEIARYCGNLAPLAVEARVAYQTKRLTELEAQVKQRISELEKQESDAREWVDKREALMKSASEGVVAIYAKMPAEPAATQIAAMEDPVAVAILVKLAPKTAGAILGEMEAGEAAKLTSLMAGLTDPEKKS
jgi:flagellar motility protein MotE (MotC chaperone)